jgi:hypothetical protein
MHSQPATSEAKVGEQREWSGRRADMHEAAHLMGRRWGWTALGGMSQVIVLSPSKPTDGNLRCTGQRCVMTRGEVEASSLELHKRSCLSESRSEQGPVEKSFGENRRSDCIHSILGLRLTAESATFHRIAR